MDKNRINKKNNYGSNFLDLVGQKTSTVVSFFSQNEGKHMIFEASRYWFWYWDIFRHFQATFLQMVMNTI